MKYWILASGSKGNCTVVESKGQYLIIDCGATRKYLLDSFARIGLDYHQAMGLLITHDHSDHIRQLNTFKSLNVYAPDRLTDDCQVVRPYEPFEIGPFAIMPLQLSHDCEHTLGYVIQADGQHLVSVTDTGYVSGRNRELIGNAEYYIFESNHDVSMLMHSSRPPYLKQRILSDYGHMDNQYSAATLCEIIGDKTTQITLAHISQECNTREIAYRTLIETMQRNGLDPLRYVIRAAKQFEIIEGGNL